MSRDTMRLPGWEQRLADLIAAYQGGGFIWGVRDCFRLPQDVARAVAGLAIWPDVRPYRTARGAAIRLARHGFSGVGDALAAVLPEVPPAHARRGDLGMVLEAGAQAGVVVLGAEIAGMAPDGGLTILPRARLVRAFAVG
ncbi:DUF6950 family protein [Xanthobacter aminoxidans]|uniref:DUF6950 family protein n=1 Tax=Xanthobacter aminoxidans TaxID=186280 RepID=UPI002022EE23|nr:hypothetical protein [Xanthobacter aminoxidans]MCL8385576.1 hypothetical protein [Xanthobacter aminoxidans]